MSASGPQPTPSGPASFAQSVAELRQRVAAKTPAKELVADLRRLVSPDMDYSSAQALARLIKKLDQPGKVSCRLAILGGFTTTQLTELIRLFLFASGIPVEIHEAEYGVFRQEILDGDSELYAFKPTVVYIATNRYNLGRLPGADDSPERVRELVAAEAAEWSGMWAALTGRLPCQIIQNNFDHPPYRAMGNHDLRHHAGHARFITQVNQALFDAASSQVIIHDADHLSAMAGRWAWSDPRFHFQAKLPCSPEHLVPYAHHVATVIAAQQGKAKKCLVLDLDNTLWGGVIGDDGVNGIRLGHGEAEGEAFQAFQHYVDGLRRRGVILAVCSKNEEQTARDGFSHPEMVLKLDHIACFMANWDDKATNLKKIAQTLEIGLDSLVFVDDNPMERDLVRRYAPDVAVPELPEDAAGYIQAVERHAYFQTTAIGSEDLQRSGMYQAQALRKDAEAKSGNIEDFLASLEMVAKVEAVAEGNAERVAQLLARSNQFNLTTRRHTTAQVLAMGRDPACLTFAISLKDRFGDNGLISVLLANRQAMDGEAVMLIDSWIMSCRVLKRGVEQFLLNQVCAGAKAQGATALIGDYLPTAKNALVKDHFRNLGFTELSSAADGSSRWRLDLATFAERAVHIHRE
jgi:FkbH-like protein